MYGVTPPPPIFMLQQMVRVTILIKLAPFYIKFIFIITLLLPEIVLKEHTAKFCYLGIKMCWRIQYAIRVFLLTQTARAFKGLQLLLIKDFL